MTLVRRIALAIAPTALVLLTFESPIGAKPTAMSCQARAPIIEDFPRNRPWRWLGECPGGRAEGLGVLLMGSEEEMTHFYGRMHAGRPVAGYLDRGTAILAYAFTPAGVAILPDSSYNMDQRHAVFVLGSRAATATSRWFAARGNRASARWYREKAREILEGEPH
jgi:hypothetical protein